jgi:type IX secretion system PorP/SprF family membrane protein
MKTLLLLSSWILASVAGQAQQDPLYALYLNNPFVLNPAYAGINDRLNMNIQDRSQWSAIQGHPETYNFNANMSLVQNKVGVGLIALQDKLGENKTNEIEMAYSYKIDFRKSVLSFGLQAGMMTFSNNNSLLNFQQTGDPSFNAYNISRFNTGAGVVLKSDRYMLGFSVPRLLPVILHQGVSSILVYQRTYYLLASYVFDLNERVGLRPAVLFRTTDRLQNAVDLNLNLQIEDFYSVGVFTRDFNTYGFLLQLIVKNYKLAYAMEVPGSKSAIPYTTNEIMFGISLRALSFHKNSFTVF